MHVCGVTAWYVQHGCIMHNFHHHAVICVCIDVLADAIWSAQKTANINILDALQVCLQLCVYQVKEEMHN